MNILQRLVNDAQQKKQQFVNGVSHVGQQASLVVDQVNPLDGGRTYQQRIPTNTAPAIHQLTHNGATNFAGAIVKPAIRSSMALNQGIGNLELKLAGRPTQNAQQYLQGFHSPSINKAVDYQGTKRQVIGDAISNVANVAMPGTSKVATGVASKVIPRVAPQVIKTLVPKVIGGAAAGAASGAVGNVGGYVASGQPMTLKGAATTAATGAKYGAAFGGALPLAAPVAKVAAKGTVQTARAVNATQKAAAARVRSEQAITAQQQQLAREVASHTKQRDSLPLNNHIAAETLQRKIDTKQAQIQQLEAAKPQRDVIQKVSDKILTTQPGMSMKAVNNNDAFRTPADDLKVGPYNNMEQALGYRKFYENNIARTEAALQKNTSPSIVKSLKNDLTYYKKGQSELEQHIANYKKPTPPSTKPVGQTEPANWINAKKGRTLVNENGEQFTVAGKSWNASALNSDFASVKDANGKFIKNMNLRGMQVVKAPTAPVKSTKPVPELPQSAVRPQLPVSRETGGVSLPDNTGYAGDIKQTKFSTTVKNSPEVSPEVSKQVNAQYQADTLPAAIERAQAAIKKNGVGKSLNQTLTELADKNGSASRDTLARALELAKIHDAKGTAASQAIAAKLYDQAAEHASAHGQSIQVLAAIARRSPAGLRNKAFRDLKGAGIDVLKPENAHIRKEIQGHIDAIAKLPDGPTKDMAIAVLQKAVSKHIPQSKVSNAVSIWKAGLLSGVKTQQGNAISNGTFGALKKISDVPAALVDQGISLGTGKRTVAVTGRGIAGGANQGRHLGFDGTGNAIARKLHLTSKQAGNKGTLVTGIDVRNIGGQGGKYEQHAEINFKNKFVQKVLGDPANVIFRGMSAADQPFYYAAMKNSLYDQAKADGLTKGLRGRALQDHMTTTATNPTESMVNTATKEAEKAVLGNDTVASRAVSAVKRSVDQSTMSPAGKQAAHTVIDVLAPFTKVPSAFIGRTIDFTPLGIPKTVISQISHGKFDQRALSQAIGEATTGTGIIALGIALSQKGLVSGDYPQSDAKEQQRWKAEGITPNSVKVGNQWVSMNYLGPVGLLFNAGHQVDQASKKGEGSGTQALAASGGLGQGLMGQSFLQGFSGFTNAITDPQRSASSYVNSQGASVVPSIVNDAANVTDKFQRQANGVGGAIANRIPGLRENNAKKQDVYGNDLKQPAGQLNTLNAFKPSNSLTNKSTAVSEVSRLHAVDPNNKDLQVTPTQIDKKISIPAANKGDKPMEVRLNDKQRYALQKQIGQTTQDAWGKLIKTSDYQGMSDSEKAKALTNMRQDATELATRKYVVDNSLGTYAKAASKSAQALANGDLSSYTTASDGTGLKIQKGISQDSTKFLTDYNKLSTDDRKQKEYSQNDYQYKALVAQFENDQKAGILTKKQVIDRKNAIDKALVGKDYSKDTRDLYSLSKADLNDWLQTQEKGIDKQKLGNELLAYDKALYDAGLSNSLKFKYGFTTASKGGSGSRSSGGSGGSRAKLTPSDFKTPFDNIIKSATKGSALARNAKLAKKA